MRSFRGKLLALIVTAVAVILAVGIIAMRSLSSLAGDLAHADLKAQSLALQGDIDMMHDAQRADAALALGTTDPAAIARAAEDAVTHGHRMLDDLTALQRLPLPAPLSAEVAAVRPHIEAYVDIVARLTAAAAHDRPAAEGMRGALGDSFDQLEDELGALGQRLADSGGDVAALTQSVRSRARWTGIGVAASSLALLAVGILMAVRVSRRLAEGVAALKRQSSAVTESANQVAEASQAMARGASSQAASIEETSAALEEIATMTRRTAGSASQSSSVTGEARGAAQQSTTLMLELVGAMDSIQGSSDEIAKIIKTIDEIAFQTNMLALNAAVEAARAGDAGLGFAVVADEVRSLSQRSAQAARDTAGKIEESIKRSATGVAITRRVHDALSEIAERVRKIDELTGTISTASQEQARGIAQTNGAMSQMDRVTQENAALAHKVATSAGELNVQAGQLLDVAGDLDEVVVGVRRAAPAAAEAVAAPGRPAEPRRVARPAIRRPAMAVLGPDGIPPFPSTRIPVVADAP